MKQLLDRLRGELNVDQKHFEDLTNKTIRQKLKLQEYTLSFAQKNEELRIARRQVTNLQREKDYLLEVVNKLDNEMQFYNQLLLEDFTLDPNAIYCELKRENERLQALVERLQYENN